jgi:hypothetical protein
MSPKHYKLDRAEARRWTDRDPEAEKQSAKEYGFYTYSVLKILPLSEINPEEVWNPSRIARIREALQQGKPLPAIHVSKGPSGKYEISDGIHR